MYIIYKNDTTLKIDVNFTREVGNILKEFFKMT